MLVESSTMKYENGDSIRGEAPLAGAWGVPQLPFKFPPKNGGQGVETAIFGGKLEGE